MLKDVRSGFKKNFKEWLVNKPRTYNITRSKYSCQNGCLLLQVRTILCVLI